MAPQDQQNSIADLYKSFASSSKAGNPEQGVIYFDPREVLPHGHTHSVAS